MTETAAPTGSSTGNVGQEHAEDSAFTEAAHRPAAEADRAEAPEQPEAAAARPSSGTEPAPAGDEEGTEQAGAARSVGVARPPRLERPTFTRPPGMTPPPEQIVEAPERREASGGVPASAVLSAAAMADAASTGSFPAVAAPSGAFPLISATAPVSAPPRPGNSPVTVRPIAASAPTAIGSAPVVGVRPRPGATPRGPRRARLNVKRVDPWSVMKFSFAVSLVLFVVVIVAASVLYLALDAMGVFTSINDTVAELVDAGGGEGGGESFRITARGVIGTAAVLGALNVLLFTSLATLGAFIYNVCADLVGGIEVTLAERD